jgi:hypothetical protein
VVDLLERLEMRRRVEAPAAQRWATGG